VSGEKWSIECDYMESCNCDFGCACNFSGFPNYGRCEVLVGYHIRTGNYREVSLDGLDFISSQSQNYTCVPRVMTPTGTNDGFVGSKIRPGPSSRLGPDSSQFFLINPSRIKFA
jgi:hypothetical protein